MPPPCSICTHPQRHRIEEALVRGRPSLRELAAIHGGSTTPLQAHKRDHLSPTLVAEAHTRAAARAEAGDQEGGLLGRIFVLVAECEALVTAGKMTGDVRSAAAAIRELRSSLELLGRATGELDDRPTVVVNLAASQEWAEVRGVILAALQPFPEARSAVARALAGQPAPAVVEVRGSPPA